MKTRKPVSLVAVVLAVLVLGSCVGGGVSVNLDAVDSATDVTGGDAGIDTVGDAGDDLGLDTSAPDGAGDALDCGKLCQGSTCGVAGPAGECDCGDCDDGYACQEGTCVADCETLCGEQACGPAGLEGECDCGGCDEGYACQEGTCVADCEGLCGLLECGPAGLEGECDCGGCDDDNPCTDDSCEAGVCGHVGLDQVPCEDDDPCTSNGFCEAGTCVSEPMDCNDGNPCTDDVCNPESGMCEYPANAEDCDDGDVCTVGDHCKEAVCAGTPASCDCAADADCADLEDGDVCNGTLFCDLTQVPPQCELVPNSTLTCPEPGGVDAPCLEAACDPETGDCGFAPAQDTYPCANEDLCTVGDTCAAGTCNDGVAANCNDGNPCTDDSCDPATGCLNTPNTTPCNDDDVCTTGDTCAGGACAGTGELACDDGNPCTDDACDGLVGCTHEPHTGECNDLNACTTGDTCMNGDCAGSVPVTCDDGDVCTTDTCDPASGCVTTDNTQPCDDGNPCTEGDICGEGVCAGAEVVCDDNNPCTDDTCDPLTGCAFTPDDENTCDDGNPCSTGDHCEDGVCLAAGTDPCDDDNLCTSDSCDPASGCMNTDNTQPCDDGNPCTGPDVCGGGDCGGKVVVCDDNNPCTDDTCDPDTGCVYTENTDPCDDLNTCTEDDTCKSGVCSGTGSLDCDDGNPCTKDICLPDGGCSHEDLTGPACDDGNPCTLNDACTAGSCTSGAGKDCNDLNPCTDDACDAQGICQHTPNTQPCDDGNACTTGDHCAAGVCAHDGLLSCDDNKVCTTDSCNPATGCANVNNTVACNDGNACTTGDVCGGGTCAGAGALPCNDGNGCTDDSCAPATGCVFTANTAPCNDGNACTTGDICAGGACTFAAALACNDNKLCTTDTCSPATGCVFTNNTLLCDDGNACTTGDVCGNAICAGAGTLACDDGKVCTTDSCNPATGCVNTNNTASCNDGNACTTDDVCAGGACAGLPKNCSNLDTDCTKGTCQAVTGTCLPTPINEAGDCDDDDPCTVDDVCAAGVCEGAPKSCEDGNPCTVDDCAGATGDCEHLSGGPVVLLDEDFANNAAGWTLDTEWAIGSATAGCDDPGQDHTDTADNGVAGVVLGGCASIAVHPPRCITSPMFDASMTTGDLVLSYWRWLNSDYLPYMEHTVEVFDGAAWQVLWTSDPVDFIEDLDWTYMEHDLTPWVSDAMRLRFCHRIGAPGAYNMGSWNLDDLRIDATGAILDCNDGDACTEDDQCTGSLCDGEAVDCDDGNPCTDDSCDPDTGCVNAFNTDACDDGNECNQFDTCVQGVCKGSGVVNCNDSNLCTDDSCDPDTGCVFDPNTNPCDDGDPCSVGDACQNGGCVTGTGQLLCADAFDCTVDSCVPGAGCDFTPVDADCSDGVACTTDTCDPDLGCVLTPVNAACNDGVACTTDTCDPLLGCVLTPVNAACNDQNPCTDDSCHPTLGCQNANNTATCNDNNACTETDVCAGGICTGTPKPCSDGKVCTVDSCDPATGNCLYSPAGTVLLNETFTAPHPGWQVGTEWEIGPAETHSPCFTGQDPAADHTPTADGKLAGVNIGGCYGTASHGDYCLTSPAFNTTGMTNLHVSYWRWLHTDYPPYVANHVDVFNGSAWTTLWAHTGSDFLHDTAWTPMDHDISAHANAALRVRWCFSVSGGAIPEAGWSLDDIVIYRDGTLACNDGNACTPTDVCLQGACTGSGSVTCDDSNECTTDACVPPGGCTNTKKLDGTPCAGGWCVNGSCVVPGTCDAFTGADSTTIPGWTEQVGDWWQVGNRLRSEASSTWQYITQNGSTRADGCMKVRATYGTGTGLRFVGLVARYASTSSYIMFKIQDNGSGGYWDSYYIYDSGTNLNYLTGQNFGTDAIIQMSFTGTAVVLRIDTNRDGTWDHTYNHTVTRTAAGLMGLSAYNQTFADDFCAGASCTFGAACQGGATLLSTAPSGTMVLCDDPTDTVCEENFGTLCPAGWHLCSHKEYNARNTGWTFSPLTRALGTIQCRSSSGAGHFTLPDQGNVGAVLNQDVAATNCWFGSSRPTCTASFGCNEQYSHALCCVTHPLCGNGVKDEPEEDCDDGNASETDPCLNNCSFRVPGMSYQGCS